MFFSLNVQATGLNLSSVPLLINTTLPKAHSLVNADISCTGPVASNPSTFWREEITHNGIAPLVSDTTYEVYRTAVQWGADNTGVNDASGAINAAIIGEFVSKLPQIIVLMNKSMEQNRQWRFNSTGLHLCTCWNLQNIPFY